MTCRACCTKRSSPVSSRTRAKDAAQPQLHVTAPPPPSPPPSELSDTESEEECDDGDESRESQVDIEQVKYWAMVIQRRQFGPKASVEVAAGAAEAAAAVTAAAAFGQVGPMSAKLAVFVAAEAAQLAADGHAALLAAQAVPPVTPSTSPASPRSAHQSPPFSHCSNQTQCYTGLEGLDDDPLSWW